MRITQAVLVCLLMLSIPANAQTDFRIQSIQLNTNGTVTLTWPADAGRTYYFMVNDRLDGRWNEIQFDAAPNATTISYTDSWAVGSSQLFYKVRRGPPHVVLTLVLDRSGSMNGAGTYVTDAVTNFLAHFSQNTDRAALVSFATTTTVNVPMTRAFGAAIESAVRNLQFSGATFAQGGLTNAFVQNNTVGPGPEAVFKTVVFFTDGMANIVQDTLNCSGTPTLLSFGGTDTGQSYLIYSPSNGAGVACNATTFNSAVSGPNTPLNGANIRADAAFRSIQVADDMRAAGMNVYSIGLGSVNTTFLQQVANDPSSPTFKPTQPVGMAIAVSSLDDLQPAFDQIALQILAH